MTSRWALQPKQGERTAASLPRNPHSECEGPRCYGALFSERRARMNEPQLSRKGASFSPTSRTHRRDGRSQRSRTRQVKAQRSEGPNTCSGECSPRRSGAGAALLRLQCLPAWSVRQRQTRCYDVFHQKMGAHRCGQAVKAIMVEHIVVHST